MGGFDRVPCVAMEPGQDNELLMDAEISSISEPRPFPFAIVHGRPGHNNHKLPPSLPELCRVQGS
jgi:hypothetical protein